MAVAKTTARRARGRAGLEVKSDAVPLETKSGGTVETSPVKTDPGRVERIADLVNEVKTLEERLTQANRERPEEKADPLDEQKADRIIADLMATQKALRARIEAMEVKSMRPMENGRASAEQGDSWFEDADEEKGDLDLEYKAAYLDYVRTGDKRELQAFMEQKDMSSLRDEDGGYFVPETIADRIVEIMDDTGDFRSLANVETISGQVFKVPAEVTGSDAGWVGEEDPRAAGKTPKVEMVEIRVAEMFALVKVTQTLLEDTTYDIEERLARSVASAMNILENDAFINGDGVNKPRGLLSYPTAANPSAYGKFQHILSGSTSGIDGATGGAQMDKLVSMQHLLKPGYRQGASWIANDSVIAFLRRLRDADGRPFLTTDTSSGLINLLGHTVHTVQEMPDIGANSLSLGWGVWNQTYTIVDRFGMSTRRLDDSGTIPFVHFYTRKRVGGGVEKFESAKFMKFAAS